MPDLLHNQNGGYYKRGDAHIDVLRLKVVDEVSNRTPGTTLKEIAERNGVSYKSAQRWLMWKKTGLLQSPQFDGKWLSVCFRTFFFHKVSA